MPEPLYVCISLDTEEEGLFSGVYQSISPPVTNIAHLERLVPLTAELGFPLTFFCSYAVLENDNAWSVIKEFVSSYRAEAGAHLHHWSTPPWTPPSQGEPTRTHKLPLSLLSERLANLLKLGHLRLTHPMTSFRMGRWDLKRSLLPLLASHGIKVDSSICPLRVFKNGPNHFIADANPYWVATEYGKILEAPITQIPLSRSAAKLWAHLWAKKPHVLDTFHFFGALSANPVWHSLAIMKLATKLYYARGGNVLNFFWHSSELLPGASPNVPSDDAANALIKKINTFCRWLRTQFDVIPITATQLVELPISAQFPLLEPVPGADW